MLPRTLSIIALVMGTCLVLVSLVMSGKSQTATGWTEEKAKEYQQASMKLHHLSLDHDHGSEDPTTPHPSSSDHQQQLADARRVMDQQVEKLEAARSHGSWIKAATCGLGISFALFGLVLYIYERIKENVES